MAVAHCVNNLEKKRTRGSPCVHLGNPLLFNFLTSIKFTFDNLSRKIKNPCLVINKNSFFKEEIIMYNFKTIFTYMVVGALVIALSISYKNDETDPNAGKFKHSDLVGTWTGDAGSFTINSSGYVNFTYQGYTHNGLLLHDMESESYGTGSSIYDSSYMAATSFSDGYKRQLARFFLVALQVAPSISEKILILSLARIGNWEWRIQ